MKKLLGTILFLSISTISAVEDPCKLLTSQRKCEKATSQNKCVWLSAQELCVNKETIAKESDTNSKGLNAHSDLDEDTPNRNSKKKKK